MSKSRILIAIVLAAFVAETAYVVAQMGYLGFFEAANANPATRLMMFDLVVALSLVAVWMVIDARRGGRSATPYLLLTAAFGAAGPLLYLLRRPQDTTAPAPRAPTAARAG